MTMNPELAKLGSSLLVPSVQELAKKPLKEVPPRYVRTDEDSPKSHHISLKSVATSSCHRYAKVIFLTRTGEAALCMQRMGFLPVNQPWSEHFTGGKSEDGDPRVFQSSNGREEEALQKSDEIEGFGQAFVVSEEQKLNWGDMFYMTTFPTYLRKPHLFPNLPITLRVLFEEGHRAMRMNYCPPCPQLELAIGLRAHSDPVGLAIVLQINKMKAFKRYWFVLRLKIVSNGVYPSVENRAAVNSVKERLSIVTLYSPRLDGDMGPAPSLLSPQNPPLLKRIGVADYFKCLFTFELRGKSYVDVLRIQPDQETNTNYINTTNYVMIQPDQEAAVFLEHPNINK
ncbi:hypothetical protein GOBAR_AA09846 [Gossypium barbadense]|uniref:Isopenicillin N synthase-like Fe(2+) 2OG dioxygenase domain-containing protein n=1 Tax=Gossypium barbadense TaxID=3634 RepID=A0A2P5Y5B4_GOSBA|nr:hypothetical protein GOBAR_AA09846 [Gossypium barbadense]